MDNIINSERTIEEKKQKKIKDRNNVNVSLRKRDKVLLNSILNSWEKEDCNISSEVCDAIILKNLSNTNPHIQTILSTLSLIESSLKSHFMTKKMTDEEISINALSIFNEVITIDIDGNKLTNLIKGVGLNTINVGIAQKNKKIEILNKQLVTSIEDKSHNNMIVAVNSVNTEKEVLENTNTIENIKSASEEIKNIDNKKIDSESQNIYEDNAFKNNNLINNNEFINKNIPLDNNSNTDNKANSSNDKKKPADVEEVDDIFGSYAIISGFQA